MALIGFGNMSYPKWNKKHKANIVMVEIILDFVKFIWNHSFYTNIMRKNTKNIKNFKIKKGFWKLLSYIINREYDFYEHR